MSKCPKCGYSNGGRFTHCPLCKTPMPHIGDRAVFLTALLILVGFAVWDLVKYAGRTVFI